MKRIFLGEIIRRSSVTKLSVALTGTVASLLLATLAVPAGVSAASQPTTGKGFGPVYDSKHEITVAGTVQEVVTKHVAGSPAGMHLLVVGPQGVVDAHLGPFLSKETQDALHAGTPVQIVGAMTTLHGKDYLLTRLLLVGGRTITVRTEHGAPVLAQSGTRRMRATRVPSKSANGGAQ